MGTHEINGSPPSSLTDLTEKKAAHETTAEVEADADADEAVFEHLENELYVVPSVQRNVINKG